MTEAQMPFWHNAAGDAHSNMGICHNGVFIINARATRIMIFVMVYMDLAKVNMAGPG